MVSLVAIAAAAEKGASAVSNSVSKVTDAASDSASVAVTAVTEVAPSAISGKTTVSPPDLGLTGYFQAIGALLLVVALLYTFLWALRRFGKMKGLGMFRNEGKEIQLLQQYHIAPKKTLVEVRYGGKNLLLGVTDQNINLLTETEETHDSESFETCLDAARADNSPS